MRVKLQFRRSIAFVLMLAFMVSILPSSDVMAKSKAPKFDFKKKCVTLNSGYRMPIIGHGTWTLEGQTCEDAVYSAIKSGARLIDTAEYYGNQKEVGNAVRKAIEEGIVKREDMFITSKIAPWGKDEDYFKEIQACNKELGFLI